MSQPSTNFSELFANRRASEQASRASNARKKSGRRRVDPSTCERDYKAEELEFMEAIQQYKQSSGRMFPTWSEVLEVFTGLGYAKAELAPSAVRHARCERAPRPTRATG